MGKESSGFKVQGSGFEVQGSKPDASIGIEL
jgi:hypothetical protein